MEEWNNDGDGYSLKNKEGTNIFPNLSLRECQILCEITDYCLYFKLIKDKSQCKLMYGMGIKTFDTNTIFGHKYNPSKRSFL